LIRQICYANSSNSRVNYVCNYLCSTSKAFVAPCSTSEKEVLHEKVSIYAAFSDFVALLAFFEYLYI
ncbi:MAG: hypothetical protein ACI4XP_04620, partial [Acutalibacteraceae bacterium]